MLLPLAALVCAGGAARRELSPGWRRLLMLAACLAAAAVGLLAARHLENHLDAPWWAVALMPPMFLFWAIGASDSKPLALLFVVGFAVSLMLWVLLGLRALGGTGAVLWAHDALLVSAAPLLAVGLWKQLRTPRPPPPPEPEFKRPVREAALQERLASDEAQEAADKYTRD